MKRARSDFAVIAAVALAALTAGLTGCTDPTSKLDPGPVSTLFEGPWADELRDAYDESSDPFVRGVLADGKITDQEHAEMIDRYISCMADGGVTMHPDTSYEIPPALGSAGAHEVDKRCTRESGDYPIGAFYSIIKRNPQNLDEATIVLACAVEKGVVPTSYTVDDYRRDVSSQNFPFVDKVTGPAAMNECSDDPLGLLE